MRTGKGRPIHPTMRFEPCPLIDSHHYCKMWTPLVHDNLYPGSLITLKDIDFCWSNVIPTDEIHEMTFDDFDDLDWTMFIYNTYGIDPIYGMILTFEYPDGSGTFKTFRAYAPRKHRRYMEYMGKQFEVVFGLVKPCKVRKGNI
jgi:hypothetical protein